MRRPLARHNGLDTQRFVADLIHVLRTRPTTAVPIIEKGLPATRPAAKANALEALLLFVEMEKPEGLIEDLVGALSHKQPKIIAATGAALTNIFNNYGCKVVDPKPVLKALPKMFGHADKNVRAEAQNLTVELYRWLKEALKPLFWGELKPVQQQDLEKLFENVKQDPPPKQERFTRAQQEAMASASAQDDGGDAGADDGEEDDAGEVDVFDLAEPVDIMPKVPDDLLEKMSSTKWKDRKDALDGLFAAANVPRIKDGPFHDIVQALAKSMKDANISVVTVAANTIVALANGLRKNFAKHRPVIMPPIMERLKEKKQSIADALGQALDAVFASTGLSDCLEDIFGFVKHKNPQVKQETVKFLIRCLRTTRDVPSKPESKSIAEAGTKLLTESSEVVRSGAAEILGTLMKILGERAMNPYLDSLDDIRKTKIKEFFESAEVKAKERPKPVVAPPKAAAAPGRKTVVKKVVKRPAPAAEPTPAPASDPEPTPVQSPAKPRGIPSKLGVTKTPGTGLKMRKLAGPGGAAPQQLASPRRVVSPPTEDVPPPISQPKFGLGRGLAGRPIAKPSPLAPEPALQPTPSAQVVSGMGAIERAELEELRLEKERLTHSTEDMRAERSKLGSEINELQNQNAQLIEDHTRDVLSIKAKETQLVRARSDAETAEQTVQKQQREIERLKRELSRALRASAASPPNAMPDMGMNIGMGDGGVYPDDMNNFNGPPSSSSRNNNLFGSSRFENSRPMSFASSNHSEERDNSGGLTSPGFSSGPGFAGRRKISPPVGTYSSGGGNPARTTARAVSYGRADGPVASPTEPGENWKRAAEVTSQLKARIEQMKVGLAVRFHPYQTI